MLFLMLANIITKLWLGSKYTIWIKTILCFQVIFVLFRESTFMFGGLSGPNEVKAIFVGSISSSKSFSVFNSLWHFLVQCFWKEESEHCRSDCDASKNNRWDFLAQRVLQPLDNMSISKFPSNLIKHEKKLITNQKCQQGCQKTTKTSRCGTKPNCN